MEKEKVIYAGIFLDERSSAKLENLIPDWIKNQPGYRSVKDRHITVYFHTFMSDNLVRYMRENENKHHTIVIDGIGLSNKVIAVRVKSCCSVNGEETPSVNEKRHITLATFNGGKPVMSNDISLWFDIPQVELNGIGKTVYSK